jgi:hypothetical protein
MNFSRGKSRISITFRGIEEILSKNYVWYTVNFYSTNIPMIRGIDGKWNVIINHIHLCSLKFTAILL